MKKMINQWLYNFDLNRTVLMSDAAGGRTMENTVNYLLSECSWGYVCNNAEAELSETTNRQSWVCVSTTPSIAPPTATTSELITYKTFVDRLYPYITTSSSANGNGLQSMQQFNKQQKKKRVELQSNFISHASSSPGHSLVDHFKATMEKLHFPAGSACDRAKALAQDMQSDTHGQLKEAWGQGRYYLLPSFLNALFYLAELNQLKPNPTFAKHFLIFRTFGNDLPLVAKEIDFLVSGTHPLFPGKQLHPSFQLQKPFGTFYRGHDNVTHLAIGTLDKVPFTADNLPETYYEGDAQVRLISGLLDIHAEIQKLLGTTSIDTNDHVVLGLRDYWEFWHAHGESDDSGKLLLIDSLKEHANQRVIFFDDHIEQDRAHIVDVRDIGTEKSLAFSESRKYIQRAEPYQAILDPNYYIDLIQEHRSQQ